MHGRPLYRNGMATCNDPNRRFLRRWLDNSMDGTKVAVENRESFPPFFYIYIYITNQRFLKLREENREKNSNFGVEGFQAVRSCSKERGWISRCRLIFNAPTRESVPAEKKIRRVDESLNGGRK